MKKVRKFIEELMATAREAPSSQYNKGYLHALEDVHEYVDDRLWDEGEE